MTPVDPVGEIAAKLLPWVAGVFLTISLFVWRIFFTRFFKRQDDLDSRLTKLEVSKVSHDDFARLEDRLATLEKNAVTHEDFRRLENKFDKLTDRINRFIEGSLNK